MSSTSTQHWNCKNSKCNIIAYILFGNIYKIYRSIFTPWKIAGDNMFKQISPIFDSLLILNLDPYVDILINIFVYTS